MTESNAKNGDGPQSSGVQDLIDRLQQEGVSDGRAQGEALVAEARREAAHLVEAARAEATKLLDEARTEAERIREGGREDVRLACRDSILSLQAQVYEGMREQLRVLVGRTLSDRSFLERLILEIGRRSVPDDANVEVVLPETMLTEEQLRTAPESLDGENLSTLVLGLTADAIREGVAFRLGDEGDSRTGLKVRLVDEEIEVDLDDESIAELLLRHLRPRFRAIVRSKGAPSDGA